MVIFDSKQREKIDFIPVKSNEVRIYICGPTVYDDAHLGHARSAISFDLLARVLQALDYKVIVARNFTDIDDKLINRTKELNKTLEEVSSHYIKSYLDDMDALNIKRPDLMPKATSYIKEISEFIQTLLDKNIAYKIDNGDIYLEVAKDAKYGLISQHIREEAQSRIASSQKKDAKDFVLWKAYKGDNGLLDIGFDSPLGKGRPGWHIECSAMINSVLAYSNEPFCIDIHAGGQDLLFPHHENEASQTRCYCDKELSKYWMHNGFVTINGEKMSKSLGNSFFLKDALKSYHGEIIRNYLLGTHYRLPLAFNELDLLSSKKRLDKIYRLKKRVDFKKEDMDLLPKEEFKINMLDSLKDDLNISMAFSTLEEMIKNKNDLLDKAPKNKDLIKDIKGNLAFISKLLGIGMLDFIAYFQLGVSSDKKEQIHSLIEQRRQAKSSKNYALADEIRASLESLGVQIMDKAGGVCDWEVIS